MYTSPNTGHDNMDLAISSLRDTYHQLFDRYGVDLVLQGHVHNYQRTFPINYGDQGNSHNPKITSYQANNYVDPAGTVFAIVGTGGIASELGKAYHNFTGPAEKYTAVQFQGIGFLDLQVVQNGTKLVGTFHDNDRTIKDHFSITKLENYQKKSLAHYAAEPKLKNGYDESFKVESIVTGLKSPTDMTFLGHDDILVLEKNNGKVQRVINGKISEKPLLDVNVSNENERGLLGVAVSEVNNKSAYVYLYYTEANASSEKCTKPDYCLPGTDPIGNRLYSFNLTQDKSKLVHPKLLLNLPATPGSVNNGGKIIIGTDNLIYLAVGALSGHNTMAQNFENGSVVDGTGGILRINSKGHPLDDGILGNEYPLNMYYAYGIRNSFGMDFDNVTGNLWNTENGPEFGDEINLVEPGFNSGWRDVQGIWKHKGGKPGIVSPSPNNLTDFEGKGKYSSPEFTFFNPVGVTAIKFFNSDKMGSGFKDDIFVADSINGVIYRFNLEEGRTSLFLKGELADKIANSTDELYPVTFAEGFSDITDLEVGADGYLYVLDYGKGAIYRIIPT
jgi:glucose/arabinose dehydrogenase